MIILDEQKIVKARYGDVRSANEMRSRRDGRGIERAWYVHERGREKGN